MENFKVMPKPRHAIWCCLVALSVYVLYAYIGKLTHVFILSPDFDSDSITISNDLLPTQESFVRALIHDIQEVTRVAAGGDLIDSHMSAEETKEWNDANPCRSRWELMPFYSLRTHVKDLPSNPLWDEVLKEYSTLHRTCVRKIGNIKNYFEARNTSTGCKFVVADDGAWIGVGNKLQVIASSVMYAILNRRVILVPTSNLVPLFTCEPFPGSSWKLDSATFPTPPESHSDSWTMMSEFYPKLDRHMRSKGASNTSLAYAAGDPTNQKQPLSRFYCSTEQAFYAKVTWVYLSGCIYTVPKLFAVPAFRPTMEALFPDKIVLTRIFRSVVLPADSVWSRVVTARATHLANSSRLVGIQVRYLGGKSQYHDMNELVNQRIMDCVVKNGILPDLANSSSQPQTLMDVGSASKIKVFIASLYPGLQEHMNAAYLPHPTVTGEVADLVQLTKDDVQRFGIDEDVQAFAEIICLSLSDHLILSPVSTFGGTSQAFGAHTPWFIEYRRDIASDALPCERAQTVEICNQYTEKNLNCEYDQDLGKRLVSDVIPYIKDCTPTEYPVQLDMQRDHQGIELITDFQS